MSYMYGIGAFTVTVEAFVFFYFILAFILKVNDAYTFLLLLQGNLEYGW
jgi:hypothetical protein